MSDSQPLYPAADIASGILMIHTTISVGGDSDTIAAITGSIAEAYYGVPEDVIRAAIEYLDGTQMEILYYFEERYPSKAVDETEEVSGTVFDVIRTSHAPGFPVGITGRNIRSR